VSACVGTTNLELGVRDSLLVLNLQLAERRDKRLWHILATKPARYEAGVGGRTSASCQCPTSARMKYHDPCVSHTPPP